MPLKQNPVKTVNLRISSITLEPPTIKQFITSIGVAGIFFGQEVPLINFSGKKTSANRRVP